MIKLYCFLDYEEAFYKEDFEKCREIALYLLKECKDKESERLILRLNSLKWDFEKNPGIKTKVWNTFLEVKKWLYVNQ